MSSVLYLAGLQEQYEKKPFRKPKQVVVATVKDINSDYCDILPLDKMNGKYQGYRLYTCIGRLGHCPINPQSVIVLDFFNNLVHSVNDIFHFELERMTEVEYGVRQDASQLRAFLVYGDLKGLLTSVPASIPLTDISLISFDNDCQFRFNVNTGITIIIGGKRFQRRNKRNRDFSKLLRCNTKITPLGDDGVAYSVPFLWGTNSAMYKGWMEMVYEV